MSLSMMPLSQVFPTSMELYVPSESAPLKRTRQSVQNLVLVSQTPQYLIGATSFPNIAKTSCETSFSFSFRGQQSLHIRIEAISASYVVSNVHRTPEFLKCSYEVLEVYSIKLLIHGTVLSSFNCASML